MRPRPTPARPADPRPPLLRIAQRAAVPSEHDEQVALFAWAAAFASVWPALRLLYAVPNAGGYRGGFRANAARVAHAKREGVKSGVPDTHLPVRRGPAIGCYVELKRVDGRLSDVTSAQRDWLTALVAEGHRCAVAFGAEAAQAAYTEYLSGVPVTTSERLVWWTPDGPAASLPRPRAA